MCYGCWDCGLYQEQAGTWQVGQFYFIWIQKGSALKITYISLLRLP